ncbi:ATP-dependent DNA helicase RecG [Gulosibacter sp. 10]|uniref:ATP-dependent DNA helicase RecG n=1 Tax=Gulosibacter sp. 10 TaxID=1255570 RepID=UPI000B35DB1C|nr:ATP-dependent DNA helicase RecG [Gulosibacter sp. 10]
MPLAELLPRKEAEALSAAFDMRFAADLVAHLPRRHVFRGELTRMSRLEDGEHVTLVAEVVSASARRMRSRRGQLVEAIITDGHGRVKLTWFNQAWRAEELVPGTRGLFSGKVGFYRGDAQLSHPDYQLFRDEGDSEEAIEKWTNRPIPIYPATAKCTSWQVQRAVEKVLEMLPEFPDPIPPEFRPEEHWTYDLALRRIHLPRSRGDIEGARKALKFTEAFELQTALLQQRARSAQQPAIARPPERDGLRDEFDAHLPFSLTEDQRLVGERLEAEIAESTPMHRLLQGEVGSGKTVVAVRAMLQVAEHGGQSAMLAPTEVLANQHLRSITESLGPELSKRLMPTLLTGSLTKTERQRALLRIVTGDARIVVGTHALISEDVQYEDLGLIVIDEQHRFGVEQRERLRRKGKASPHVLVLTATPIPRTVAMTTFGDLDVSTLRELPGGRAGISSFLVGLAEHPHWIERVWERTAEELAKGRQAFVVCPSIEPGEPGEGVEAAEDEQAAASVAEVLEQLREHPLLAGRRIEPLHGRMSAEEKDSVMLDYAAGRIDVVVATTVIEVGVNVPNASTMIVLDADRFGVSQLHQLRGRVGRGEHAGVCLLVTAAPQESLAYERVSAVAGTLDGFELAERDVELRREGDVLGSAQSGGRSSLKLLRVTKDADVIAEARLAAAELIERDPELRSAPVLRESLRRLSGAERAHLEMG